MTTLLTSTLIEIIFSLFKYLNLALYNQLNTLPQWMEFPPNLLIKNSDYTWIHAPPNCQLGFK